MSILVIDLARVLKDSPFAKEAEGRLEARFREAKERYEGMRTQAKGSQGPAAKALVDELTDFERQAVGEIEQERQRLQQECLARAQEVARDIASARGATFVLDKRAAPVAPADADITDEVLARLSA